MRAVSNRSAGGAIAGVGVALAGYHVHNAAGISGAPLRLLVDALPVVLALVMSAVGVEMVRGRLVPDRFAGRMLAWTAVGGVLLSALGVWMATAAEAVGPAIRDPVAPMLNVATFGALVGLLVGIYDVRGLERQQSVEQLNRINNTLRIATKELVNRTDRDDLEQAVCDRFSESDAYEAVWIGRYDEADGRVRPAAWSGLDDDYFESIDVTVDDSPTGGGAGGRAIKTREIQCVPDVFADESMAPWWDMFESRGVKSLAVVPIGHGDTVYGFVSIYADRHNVFDRREREVLTELGETIGHAIAAIEANGRLARRERELARQNERLEEFAGIVSHDLRNPLNVAVGNLELARETGDDGDFARAGDAMDRMDELISDLLTLARQGALVDDFERVPLRDVVEEARSTAGSAGSTLEIDGDLGEVSCDRGRLRQLLENLIRNAVEHAGPEATVTVSRTETGFAVEDDGPGIPADRRESVFDAGYSTNDEGTGFGLNIVRSIAEAHGWDVSVGESPDGGARFEFSGVTSVDAETEVA